MEITYQEINYFHDGTIIFHLFFVVPSHNISVWKTSRSILQKYIASILNVHVVSYLCHLAYAIGPPFLSARYLLNRWAFSFETCWDIRRTGIGSGVLEFLRSAPDSAGHLYSMQWKKMYLGGFTKLFTRLWIWIVYYWCVTTLIYNVKWILRFNRLF